MQDALVLCLLKLVSKYKSNGEGGIYGLILEINSCVNLTHVAWANVGRSLGPKPDVLAKIPGSI
jgi:hypothetical protein